jgi:recombination protein RecA
MSYGPTEVTTGGKALKFYASQRIDIRRIGALKKGEDVIGNITKVKIAKNKVAPPFKTVQIDVVYGQGFSREGDIIDLGIEEGFIRKSGAWFSTKDGEQLGQGKEGARQFLKDNPGMAKDLEDKIKAKLGIGPKAAVIEEDDIPSDDEIARRVAAED